MTAKRRRTPPRGLDADAPSPAPTTPAALVFPGALAPAGTGRKAWTQDSDGEGVLSITIPAIAADTLGGQLAHLRDRTFRVVLVLDDDATRVDTPIDA